MTPTQTSLLVVLLLAAPATAGPALRNPDFERGEPGRPADGWSLREISARQGYAARVTDRDAAKGRLCLEVGRKEARGFGEYGRVTQSVPADGLRGKRVRFTASVRTSGLSGFGPGASLYARVHRPGFRPGHRAEMLDRPERGTDGGRTRSCVDVADDAERLEVGFVLTAAGTAWFDAAALEVLGPAGVGNDPPRPLAGRGLGNVEAFARLLAYVRFFHPSDGSAAADWGRFAVEGVGYVEGAATPEELAGRLAELFAPLAPAVQVFPTGKPPAAPKELAARPAGVESRVVAWRHVGANPDGTHGHYKHERVADRELPGAPPLAKSPEPLPKPADTYEADLGGGVSCRVPLALYADATGTLPRATAKPRPPAKPADFPPTGDDRATRLACVCLAWGVLQHFYPYHDEAAADWPAALREALSSAATDADAAAFHDTLRRLVARLRDSHGAVRPGSGARAQRRGVAARLGRGGGEAGRHLGGPGRRRPAQGRRRGRGDRRGAGRRPAEGGRPAGQRGDAGAPPLPGLPRPAERPGRAAGGARAPHPGGEAYRLTLTRRAADDAPLRGPSMREPRLDRTARPAPGVVYLDLDRHDDASLPKVLAEAQKADGVVFDVRGYPAVGMYWLRLMADRPLVTDAYSDVITRSPDRRGVALDTRPWPPQKPLPGGWKKVAFLTDGRAVSYAETFLAAVDNTGIGAIVGEPTAGSNGGVALYALPDGTRVSWTGQKAVRADGGRLHGVGVQPTVAVRRTLKGLAEGRDEALERAIELVKRP